MFRYPNHTCRRDWGIRAQSPTNQDDAAAMTFLGSVGIPTETFIYHRNPGWITVDFKGLNEKTLENPVSVRQATYNRLYSLNELCRALNSQNDMDKYVFLATCMARCCIGHLEERFKFQGYPHLAFEQCRCANTGKRSKKGQGPWEGRYEYV